VIRQRKKRKKREKREGQQSTDGRQIARYRAHLVVQTWFHLIIVEEAYQKRKGSEKRGREERGEMKRHIAHGTKIRAWSFK